MRASHTDDPVCPLCQQKLLTAHPFFHDWFARQKQKYPNLHISWAYRGKEDQERVYADGKSNARFGQSAHNAVDEKGKPRADALDLFQIDEDGVARFSPTFMAKLWGECKDDGLIWGGNFRKLGDFCHFQRKRA